MVKIKRHNRRIVGNFMDLLRQNDKTGIILGIIEIRDCGSVCVCCFCLSWKLDKSITYLSASFNIYLTFKKKSKKIAFAQYCKYIRK